MNTPTGNPTGPQTAQGAAASGPAEQPGSGGAHPGQGPQAGTEGHPNAAGHGGGHYQVPPAGGYSQPPPEGMYGYGAYAGAAPPPGYGYGAYAPPQYAAGYGYQAPPGMQMPPPADPGVQANGFDAALNDIADKSGLGMLKGFFTAQDGDFWKGALVGAAVVILMTNDELRNSLLQGAAKAADAVKSGFNGNDENHADNDETAGGDSPADTAEEHEA